MAAEGPLLDPAVRVARPGDAPVIELEDLLRHGVHEAVDHVLVGQEVGALDRVPGVQLEGVALLRPQHGGRAPFGADRVGAHELHLGDDPDVDLALQSPRDLDRGPQPGQAGSEDQDVMGSGLWHLRSPWMGVGGPLCRRREVSRAGLLIRIGSLAAGVDQFSFADSRFRGRIAQATSAVNQGSIAKSG